MQRERFGVGKPVRVGLLGAGFILNDFLVPALKEISGAEIVAVAGRREGAVEDFGKRWGIKQRYHGSRGVARLCKDPTVDAVLVALPNDLHLSAVTAAAENHKDLICEKPLGRNSTEARKALDVVRRYGVLHCYAENQIFMPQIARVREFIRGGAIGKPVWIRSREAHSGPHSRWFWDPERAGGGVMLDMGCHSVEVVRNLFGRRPQAVSGWKQTLVHETKLEDNSLVLVRHEGRVLGQSENSWSAKGGLDIRLEVYGSEGTVFVDSSRETGIKMFTLASGKQTNYIVEKADTTKGWTFPTWQEFVTNGYLSEMRHFISTIAAGKKACETFEDGLVVNKIIDAAYASARTSKWVGIT
jgi:predicted dehydrogenase